MQSQSAQITTLNKSPEPTAVGAFRSAIVVHVAVGGGSAFYVGASRTMKTILLSFRIEFFFTIRVTSGMAVANSQPDCYGVGGNGYGNGTIHLRPPNTSRMRVGRAGSDFFFLWLRHLVAAI